jgi:hypothetical protein
LREVARGATCAARRLTTARELLPIRPSSAVADDLFRIDAPDEMGDS